jgi:hypothetical protein
LMKEGQREQGGERARESISEKGRDAGPAEAGPGETAGEVVPEKPLVPVIRANIEDWLGQANYGKAFGDQFKTITQQDEAPFGQLMGLFVQRKVAAVQQRASALGMELVEFVDTVSQQRYWLLRASSAFRGEGRGYYFVPHKPRRDLVLQAPHPSYDLSTARQGGYLLRQLAPRLLMVASLHRCNSRQKTPCSGSTGACSGSYRLSDVAHSTQTHFHLAHRAVVDHFPRLPVLQLHGFAYKAGDPSAILSDGTSFTASSSSLVLRLRDALNVQLKAQKMSLARSCNDPRDGQSRLCGGTNVQGRYSNGSSQPCSQSAPQSKGTFLHLEQRLDLRRANQPGPVLLLRALLQLFP